MDGQPPRPSEAEAGSDDEILVAETGYAQLCDDGSGDDEAGHDATLPHLGDLERAIDQRLHAETAERCSEEPERTAPPTREAPEAARGPITVATTDEMPAEHVAQIRHIMAGIQLSEDATPEWAKRIPESAWMPRRTHS
ncbi:hypothetical protein IWQ57_001076 [Coemansia nantahalensis]|uniref:Uncharacterized protein n=1 Tax=Coemansia nantahalensis TaxID=2789366 RepID=A0ACC1K6A1_9FUNG|nr:hypothetical protein IWQ57_001076 [Coemansia nantahalensis]